VTPSAYRLQGIEQVYDARTVLRIRDLDIPRGEVFTVLGPNGSGKTTLLRLLALLEAPTRGSVTLSLASRDFSGVDATVEERRKVTMVFQRPILLTRTVRENVAYGLRLRGQRDERGRIDALLDKLGLSRLADAPSHNLSGGEAQRVALARALILDPHILLLDEPTANLDPASGVLIEQMIRETHQREGVTVVLVTHNIFQARRLATRAMLLLDGELIEEGEADQFFNSPRDARTARFLAGEMTF
jgi:tungstate transport system ATP-binding protein